MPGWGQIKRWSTWHGEPGHSAEPGTARPPHWDDRVEGVGGNIQRAGVSAEPGMVRVDSVSDSGSGILFVECSCC
jgi:hypothetical protein